MARLVVEYGAAMDGISRQVANEKEVVVVVGVQADEPEDLNDVERAVVPHDPPRKAPKVGRNELCPRGSGDKLEKCRY